MDCRRKATPNGSTTREASWRRWPSPVFSLLGAKGLGVSQDYHTAKMPPVNVGLLDGQLAWRQDDGGHTDAPNMKYFLKWADGFIGHTRSPAE